MANNTNSGTTTSLFINQINPHQAHEPAKPKTPNVTNSTGVRVQLTSLDNVCPLVYEEFCHWYHTGRHIFCIFWSEVQLPVLEIGAIFLCLNSGMFLCVVHEFCEVGRCRNQFPRGARPLCEGKCQYIDQYIDQYLQILNGKFTR